MKHSDYRLEPKLNFQFIYTTISTLAQVYEAVAAHAPRLSVLLNREKYSYNIAMYLYKLKKKICVQNQVLIGSGLRMWVVAASVINIERFDNIQTDTFDTNAQIYCP